MFVWADDADDDAKRGAWDAVKGLESAPDVGAVTIGENVGDHSTDYDWIVDVQVTEPGCDQGADRGRGLRGGDGRGAPATKHEWTARLSHLMRGI